MFSDLFPFGVAEYEFKEKKKKKRNEQAAKLRRAIEIAFLLVIPFEKFHNKSFITRWCSHVCRISFNEISTCVIYEFANTSILDD